MVHEAAFRRVREELNDLPCVFERALIAHHAVCQHALRRQIAEREAVACGQPQAEAVCATLSALLRENSAFALGVTDTRRILPHAMMMKIQCGGLEGLRALLDAAAAVPDVPRLADLARERYGELAGLPFSEIVQGVAAWKVRRRRPGAPR
jgi:hypothetical protein